MQSSKLTDHCTPSGDLLLSWDVATFWLSQVLGSGYVVQGLFLLCMLLFLYTRSSVEQERWRVWDVLQGRLHQVYPQRFAWWSKYQIDHQVKRKSWTCELVVFISLVVSRYWHNKGIPHWIDAGVSGTYFSAMGYLVSLRFFTTWFGALSWYVKASSNEVGCRRLHVLGILWTRDPTLNNPSKED